jgi:hypothetical protein
MLLQRFMDLEIATARFSRAKELNTRGKLPVLAAAPI